MTPPAALPGVYAIPAYAREVTVRTNGLLGAALVMFDSGARIVTIDLFFFQNIVNVLGRDFVAVPEGARWWSLALIPTGPNPPPPIVPALPRVVWRLHV